MAIVFANNLFTSYGDNSVRVRFDDGEVTSVNWRQSDNGMALFAPTAEPVFGIRNSLVMHVEFSPPLNSAQYTRFELSGSQAAVDQVLTACSFQGEELDQYNARTLSALREGWIARLEDRRTGLNYYLMAYNRMIELGLMAGVPLNYQTSSSRPVPVTDVVDALFRYMEREDVCLMPDYLSPCPFVFGFRHSGEDFLRGRGERFPNRQLIDQVGASN